MTIFSTKRRLVAAAFAALAATGGVMTSATLDLRPALAATPSKLGDLSAFRSIVIDTISLVDKNDLAGAKALIKALETSWDEAEPSLKPRAAADWHLLDKAIDKALAALRTGTPDGAACKSTLTEVLTIMDRFSGKS